MPNGRNRSETHSFIAPQLAIIYRILIEILLKSTSSKALNEWPLLPSTQMLHFHYSCSPKVNKKKEKKKEFEQLYCFPLRTDDDSQYILYFVFICCSIRKAFSITFALDWMWCVAVVQIDIYTIALSLSHSNSLSAARPISFGAVVPARHVIKALVRDLHRRCIKAYVLQICPFGKHQRRHRYEYHMPRAF